MASPDTNNFSSSPHRLPTLSASEALQNLTSAPRKPISTGLHALDAALQGGSHHPSSSRLDQDAVIGGLPRGEVAEVYGPPGVGKTVFAMQVATNVLRSGGSVVWLDASHKAVGPRLRDCISNPSETHDVIPPEMQTERDSEACLDAFHHFTVPTLPHLLTLVNHTSPSFPPPNTSLIVLDSVSTLFAQAYHKTIGNADNQQTLAKKSDSTQWALGRRWAVMGDLVSKMGRLAVTKNITILLTNQTITKVRLETGALLQPAMSGTAWDSGIGTRIVLLRDWMFHHPEVPGSQGEYVPNTRFAAVIKPKGMSHEDIGKIVTLRIEKDGLKEVRVDHADIRLSSSPILSATTLKRKRDEVADSEVEDDDPTSDQEFGWTRDEDPLHAEDLPG